MSYGDMRDMTGRDQGAMFVVVRTDSNRGMLLISDSSCQVQCAYMNRELGSTEILRFLTTRHFRMEVTSDTECCYFSN